MGLHGDCWRERTMFRIDNCRSICPTSPARTPCAVVLVWRNNYFEIGTCHWVSLVGENSLQSRTGCRWVSSYKIECRKISKSIEVVICNNELGIIARSVMGSANQNRTLSLDWHQKLSVLPEYYSMELGRVTE